MNKLSIGSEQLFNRADRFKILDRILLHLCEGSSRYLPTSRLFATDSFPHLLSRLCDLENEASGGRTWERDDVNMAGAMLLIS